MRRIFSYSISSFLILILWCCQILHAQGTKHPLDPLSWQEYWQVLEVLQKNDHLDEKTGFSHINLVLPDKSVVWNWKPGMEVPRSAFAIVHQDSATFKAEINLVNSKLEKWEALEGIQPTWLDREFQGMTSKVKEHPEFIAAMKKRGYEDLTFIDAHFWPPGYYGTEEQKDRRIAHSTWVDVSNARNVWSREITGLTVVVDLDTGELLRFLKPGKFQDLSVYLNQMGQGLL